MIDSGVSGLRRGAAWLGMVAVLLALTAGGAAAQLTDQDVEQIPAGSQPIKFSHQVHATDLQVPCEVSV